MEKLHRTSSDLKKRYSYDKSFLMLLCMLGIRLNLCTKRRICRRLCTPLSLVLHSSLMYCWYSLLGQYYFPQKLHLFTFICCSLSISLWYHMLLTTKSFERFLGVLRKRDITLHNSRVRNISRIALTTAVLFPVFLTTVLIIPIRMVPLDGYVSRWRGGYRNHENPAIEFALPYLGMLSFYSLKFTIPSLSVALSVILNLRLSEAVREQTRRVEESVLEGKGRSLGEEIEKYQAIVDCCERYRDCSKGTMLILCALYFTVTYTGLGVVFYKQTDLEIVAIMESVYTISGSVFSVVNLLGYGSGIPDAMGQAASRFQVLFRDVLLRKGHVKSSRDLMLLRSVGEMKPVYLTAGDLMRVRKSLILTSFGCTITYCLLIMQVNPTGEKIRP